MIKRNVTVNATPNGGDAVTYEVGSVEDAIKHKEMLVGKVGDAEVFMPYGSLITAEVESETEEVDDPEDDACVTNGGDCSTTKFYYESKEDNGPLGDELTIRLEHTPGHISVAAILGNKGEINPDELDIIDAKSITSSDPSVASASVEESSGFGAIGQVIAHTVGETVVTIVLINGCSHTVKVTVVDD